MRAIGKVPLLLVSLFLCLSASCRQPQAALNRFWFDYPELITVTADRAGRAGLSATSLTDCTPPPDTWRPVPDDRQLPVDRGRLRVWLSPGALTTDRPGEVQLTLNGSPLANWTPGTTLHEPAFFYSPGGFLQVGLYLALAADVQPKTVTLSCRQTPPLWARMVRALEDNRSTDTREWTGLQSVGWDSRRALPLPPRTSVTFSPPADSKLLQVSLAVACREVSPDTRIRVINGTGVHHDLPPEPDRWLPVSLEKVVGPVRVNRTGSGADACFIADPLWMEPAAANRPGILVVIIDGLRHDVAADATLTPELNRWAEGALRFSNARVNAPWTRPSVTSMLTGLTPREHGLVTESQTTRLAAEISTLPEVLRRHGYTTASFSANPWLGPNLGLDRGFGRLMTLQADARDVLWEAAQWIEAQRGPWLAVVFLMDTHYPFHHRPDFDRTSSNPAQPLDVGDSAVSSAYRRDPKLTFTQAAIDKTQDLYLENVGYADRELHEFLSRLEDATDAAVIAVTADHGEAFGEHHDFFHGWNLYDELLRVPLLVRTAPRAAGIDERPVALRQLPATLLELAGIDDHPLPGPSLLAEHSQPRPQFASTRFRDMSLDAVVLDRWKLVKVPRQDHCQLYDLVRDPSEAHNLCSERPETAATLGKLLDAHRAGATHQPQLGLETDESVDEALRSLGYLE